MTAPASELRAPAGPAGAGPARTAERRLVVALFVAALLSSTVAGNAWRLGLPISPDRVLLPAAVALLLLAGLHRQGATLAWRPVHALMAATAAWALWSALVHGTLWTSYGAFALLDRLVIPFAAFCLAPVVFRDPEDRAVLLKALVGLGLYLGATAVFEVLGPASLVFPRYVMDPGAGILFGRARGPFVAAEADGMVLAACGFAAGLATTRLSGAWRLAARLAVPVTAVGLLLTLTRSVWAGALVGALVVALMVPVLRRRLPVLVAGAAAAVAALLIAVPPVTDVLVERLTTQRSVHDRQNTNAAALRIIAEQPLTGIGWVRFLDVGIDHVRQHDDYPVTNVRIEVHNVLLARAAELGVPGAVLWGGAVVAGPLLAARRRPAAGALGAGALGAGGLQELQDLEGWRLVLIGTGAVWASCVMLSPVPYPLPNTLFWLLGGIVARPWLFAPDAARAPA